MSEAKKLNLEARVAALEAEIAQIRAKVGGEPQKKDPWWETIWGSFANDPAHEEAMRLGREYRESLRPKPRKRPAKKKSAKK